MAQDFAIPNLSCGHCVRAVTEALIAADPQALVQADLPSRHVVVESMLPRETLAQVLAAAGYPPS